MALLNTSKLPRMITAIEQCATPVSIEIRAMTKPQSGGEPQEVTIRLAVGEALDIQIVGGNLTAPQKNQLIYDLVRLATQDTTV